MPEFHDLVMKPEENRRFYEKIYNRLKDSPTAFAFTSLDLRTASEVLFEKYRNNRFPDGEPIDCDCERLEIPATMLFGYSMENLIKGFLVKMHGGFENAKKNVNAARPNAWNHDLAALGEATGFSLSADQKLWLETLTAVITWAGRYPTPKNVEKFTLEKQFNAGSYVTPITLDSEAIKLLTPFVQWLELEIFGDPSKALEVPVELL